MPFTGDEYYGWRMASRYTGHHTNDGTGRYVDQLVIELVKGQRHIECIGQQGIDPDIVLMRAITAALHDDIREATGQGEDVASLIETLRQHEVQRELKENGWISRRLGTVFAASTIGTGAGD
jgi:hypothetical protein